MILRRMFSGSLFVAIVVAAANAFSVPLQRSSSVAMMVEKPFFTLPNPFASSSESDQAQTAAVKNRFDSSPDGLIAQAKAVVATDLGVQDESLLAENFMWIGPQLGSDVLGKTDYLAAGKFFDLRSAFPDLDYRAHDFRIDSEDNMTVRLTARTIGTMQGQLRLRSGVLAPINGKALLCPPEAISITFSKDGKVTKLCSGFTMDRLVGNTGGLCGMMAAATVAGAPPSEWEVYPVTTVLNRFIGRPVRQLSDAGSSAPFPEKVMIQLANDIVAANMSSRDPDLLGPKFTFCGPYVGPVDKKTFLERYAVSLFGGLEPQLTHFRVDPYDAYRVWVDVRVTGVVNDVKIDISPQAMSFTFDDDGFCTRLTAGAVMDPSVGNSGGLGGLEGAKCAVGTAELDIVTRPLPIVFSRLRKRLLEPMTKIGADDYKVNSAAISLPKSLVLKPESQPEPELPPLNASKKQSTPKPATEESSPILSLFTFTRGNGGDIEVASQENLQEAVVKTAQIEAGFQKAKDEAATKQLVPRKKVDAQKKDLEITRQQTELKKEIDEQAKSAVAAKKAQQAVTAKKEEERLAAAKKQSLLEAKAATDVAKQEAAEKAKAAAVAREQAVEEARVVANKAKVEAAKIVQATVLAKKQEQAGEAKRKAEKLAVAKKLAVDKAKAAAEKLKAVAAAKEQEKAVEAKRQADTKKQAVEKAAAKEQDKSVEAKQQAEKLALAKKRAVEEAKAAADKAKAAAAAKKQEQAVEAKRQTEKLALAKKQAVEEAMAASVRAKAAAAAKKQEQAVETKRQAEKVAIAKKQEAKAAADKAKAVALAKKQEQVAEAKRLAEKLALAKKQAIEEAKMATGEVKRKAQEIAVKPILASKKDAPSMKSASARAPRGVPTLKKWTTNRDGTITGLITGSNVFDENERVTTSVISLGKISSGEVVQTKSGSKYFLS